MFPPKLSEPGKEERVAPSIGDRRWSFRSKLSERERRMTYLLT
jgi:hypothetical protein